MPAGVSLIRPRKDTVNSGVSFPCDAPPCRPRDAPPTETTKAGPPPLLPRTSSTSLTTYTTAKLDNDLLRPSTPHLLCQPISSGAAGTCEAPR